MTESNIIQPLTILVKNTQSKIFYAVAKAHLMTQNDSLLSIESTGQ